MARRSRRSNEKGDPRVAFFLCVFRALLLRRSVNVNAGQMNSISQSGCASRRNVVATARNCIEIARWTETSLLEYPGGALTLAGAAEQTLAK